MKLTGESKLFLGVTVVTIALIGLAGWFFTKPTPTISFPKETLIPASAHNFGNTEAAVYLVEFSDFQCPACSAFAPTVKIIRDTYKDTLLFVYRHFPLPSHPYAQKAASAAEAAAMQGKFWEAEEYLFAHQNEFNGTFWASMGDDLGIVQDQFERDMESDAVKKIVERDASQAQLFGLPGTPSFFLNGVLLTNLYGPEDLVKAVEEALQ